MTSREQKRAKAIADYHAKKSPTGVSGGANTSAQVEVGAASESLSMDFSMAPKKKKATKMPARFARMQIEQETRAAKESLQESSLVKEPQQIDLATRLPSAIFSKLTEITAKLEMGEVAEAYGLLKTVKTDLLDESRYISATPVDLALEHRLHQNVYAYRQDQTDPETGHLYKKVHSFISIAADPNAGATKSSLSMRELIKAKKIAKRVEDNDFSGVDDHSSGVRYLPYVQAIVYNYFSALTTFPVYVHAQNADDVVDFLMLSLEMGGFPLCDAVYEDESMIGRVQSKIGHQRQLMTANHFNYRAGVLHLLAAKSELDEAEKQMLGIFLEIGSLQRANLFQKDHEGREPLAIAIESKNVDFIKIIAGSTASLEHHNWFQFFNIGSLEFLSTLVTQFTPPKQTEFAKLRQQKDSQGVSRFDYLSTLLVHLKANLQMRIQSGKESADDLIRQIDSVRNKTTQALEGVCPGIDRESELNSIAKLHGTSVQGLLSGYQRGKPCFDRMVHMASQLEGQLAPVDHILFKIFNRLQLKSGYLIQQLCIQATASNMKMFTEQVCPGLSHQLYRSIVPLFSIDTGLDSVQTQHFPIRFPFEPDSDFTYCYALKLSMLFDPDSVEMHELILSQMSFDDIEPFLLEVACLIGLSRGTDNQYFQALIDRKPWLFGEEPPMFEYTKNVERKKVPQQALQLYSEEAYVRMVITIGKILIRQHETQLFEQFFYSQNCMYMSDQILSELVQESLTYLVPDCLVPIYALCSLDYRLNLEEFEKKAMDYQSNQSDKMVTESMLQDALAMQKAILEHNQVHLPSILRVSRQEMTDKIVNLMLEHKTVGMHARTISKLLHSSSSSTNNQDPADDVESQLPTLHANFISMIYRNCSIEVTTRVIEAEWARKSGQTDQRLIFFGQLLAQCMDNRNQVKMDKINQVHHFKNFQKKTADLAMHQFKDACFFPDQLQIIQESLEQTDLARDVSGRIGIELDTYLEVCTAAVASYEQVQQRHEQRYAYSEIGSAAAGAIKKADRDLGKGAGQQQVKIKAVIQNAPSRHNMLEEVVEWRKFDKIKYIFDELLASPLTPNQMLTTIEILTGQHHYSNIDQVDAEILPIVKIIHKAENDKISHMNTRASYKILMLKPLIIQMMTQVADQLFPIAPEIIKAMAAYLEQKSKPHQNFEPVNELKAEYQLLQRWSRLFSDILLCVLFPSLNQQRSLRVSKRSVGSHNEITLQDTSFRATYINLIDQFTDELTALLEKKDQGRLPYERLKQMNFLQWQEVTSTEFNENHDGDDPVTLSKQFNRINPLLPGTHDQTDEPIQQEPYLRLLKDMLHVYQSIIVEAPEVSPHMHKQMLKNEVLHSFFENILAYQDSQVILTFLEHNEGIFNVFNFMTSKDLVEILKRKTVEKQVKQLAIRRWLASTGKDKVDAMDGERVDMYADLVSFTTYFSDKYRKTSGTVACITQDAQKLLLELIKSQQLYEDFRPEDLPHEILQACADERMIFFFLQTPPRQGAQEESFLAWLGTALNQVQKVDNLLHLCPRLFSWSSRVLLKACPRGFKLFCDWFQRAHPQGKSLLEAEVESQANKNKLLVELIAERRFEIIEQVREMATGTPLWNELKVIRASINLDQGSRSRPRGDYTNYYDDESEDEEELDSIEYMALPYFFALSSSMFDLCEALMPDRSIVLEPVMTMEECNLLASKLVAQNINPIHFKDQNQVQKLQAFDAEIARFGGIQEFGLIKLLRMLPKLDPRVILEAVKVERRCKKSPGDRLVEAALDKEASQHIEFALTYIDLGLVADVPTIIESLLKKCTTKQAMIEGLARLLSHYQNSSDPNMTAMLIDFKHEMLSVMPGHGQFKSALAMYLDQHLMPLKRATTPIFEDVFQQGGNPSLLHLLTWRVMLLMERDSEFWEAHTAKFDVSMRVQKNASLLLTASSGFGDLLMDHRDKIFVIAKFWLRLMIQKKIMMNVLPHKQNNSTETLGDFIRREKYSLELKKKEMNIYVPQGRVSHAMVQREKQIYVLGESWARCENKWISTIFWSMDVRTTEQMLELANLLHQMIAFDPLVYNLEKQKLLFWQALDSRREPSELQELRRTDFFGRLAMDCIQCGSDDLAMISFITRKVLRIGFYEVIDDQDDLREEALVQFDVDKAMKTIYSTLMTASTNSDVFMQAKRAITILSSFQEEVKAEMMSPPLSVEIKFSLNGQSVEFNLCVCELAGGIQMLNVFMTVLEKIKDIEDVQHRDLYEQIFQSGVIHEYIDADATNDILEKLQRLVQDEAYIAELRQRNVAQSQQFIFEGFFNKLIAGFTGEWAVQFAEACVDPQLDLFGLKNFLEEAMATSEQAAATINSVFENASWEILEEVLQARGEYEIFAGAKLVIKRTSYQEMCSNSKDNFRATQVKFNEMVRSGQSSGDVELVLCFDEASKKILIDMNRLLPFFYVLMDRGSKHLMSQGTVQNFNAVNKPILVADICDFCDQLLESDDLVPPGEDFSQFLKDLLKLDEDVEGVSTIVDENMARDLSSFADQVTSEVNDCKQQHVVRKTAKIAFTYSKLAAIVVRFHVIGEPSYPGQVFEFGYADMNPEPFEQLPSTDEEDTENMLESRPDLVILGRNMQQVREEQTAKFAEIGFTRRPKSIRSLVATIHINFRMKKKATQAAIAISFDEEEEEKKE